MASERIEHTYNCSVDTFWGKIYFDEEYNRRLFLECLKFEAWQVVSFDESEERIVRVTDVKPKVADLPGPLKKLAEKGLGYRETGTFDKKTQRFMADIQPESLRDKLTIKGEMHCEPVGTDKCRRIFEVSATAKVFGVGGMIEKRILSDIAVSYEKAAAFTNGYITEKGY
jgi:hypothetical protein